MGTTLTDFLLLVILLADTIPRRIFPSAATQKAYVYGMNASPIGLAGAKYIQNSSYVYRIMDRKNYVAFGEAGFFCANLSGEARDEHGAELRH